MPVKNIIPGQKVAKEKLQRDPHLPPPNPTMKTLNPHSDFTLSYLGEVPVRAVGVALKFFFGDLLTWDDVLDWHGGIVMQNKTPRFPRSSFSF